MEELQELIKYLKDNGYAHLKINPDLLIGIIEYFASKQEPKQCTITDVSQRRKQLVDFCTKLELKAKQYSYLIPDEDFIDEYLKDN